MKLKIATVQLYKHRISGIEGTISSDLKDCRFVMLKLTKQYINSIMVCDTAPFGYIFVSQDELIKI